MSDLNCPKCGESGFDYEGKNYLKNMTMSVHTCWGCGKTFAVEEIDHE